MLRKLNALIIIFLLITELSFATDEFSYAQTSAFKAYQTYSNLNELIQNPERSNEIEQALDNIKENWDELSKSHLGDAILKRSLKLKRLKVIMDGLNKCLSDGDAQKRMAMNIVNSIRSMPEKEIIVDKNCISKVIDNLSVISADSLLNMYAPISFQHMKYEGEELKGLVKKRWDLLNSGDTKELHKVNEQIADIEEKLEKKEQEKIKAKKEIREKLHAKVKQQMVRMHGIFNYLLEDEGDEKKTKEQKVEESLRKTCLGCSKEELSESRKTLLDTISNLERFDIKPVNTERFRNKFQNDVISLAGEIYDIEERRIYDSTGNLIQRRSPEQDFREERINYKYNPGTNVFTSKEEALEAMRKFNNKRDQYVRSQYGQLSQVGIIPSISDVQVKLEKETLQEKPIYRVNIQRCTPGKACSEDLSKNSDHGLTLGKNIGKVFNASGLDLAKFKKTRLGAIEDAMSDYENILNNENFDELLDKLILNNPIMAGELLAENPESYLQILCERAEIIASDKNFDDKLRNVYLNATTALIIGGFIFATPIASAPILASVLFGTWYGMTGVSMYFGVNAYNNSDLAKASCYTGTGSQDSCAMVKQYYEDQKTALLFGVMVPGSHLLRYADVANRAAIGVNTNIQGAFNTAVSIRSRVLTFKSQGEYWANEAYTNQVENSVQEMLNLTDKDLETLSKEDRVEIVSIIQQVTEKEGEDGVRNLVMAIKSIKYVQDNSETIENELSGLKLLQSARKLKDQD